MVSWAEDQLAILKRNYPGWDVWTVPIYRPNGTRWCARPKGHPIATINVDSPEQLVAAIAEQECQRPPV